MGLSSRKSVSWICSSCATAFSSTIWMILDTQEHPEEITRMRQGEFHRVPCPTCGAVNTVQTALLVHEREARMVIAMLPPSLEPYQGKEQTRELVSHLLTQLSPEHHHPYLGQIRMVQDITDLIRLLDKATRPSNETRISVTNEKKPPLHPNASVEAIQRLLMANTIDEFRGIVRRYPLLLQPETDQVLHQFIELALIERDVVLAEGLKHARAIIATMRGCAPGQTLPPFPPLPPVPSMPVTNLAGNDAYHGDQELVAAYWALLQARTWDELHQAIAEHPLLFGATVDEIVDQWVDPILLDGHERLALLLIHRGERLEEIQQRLEKGIDNGETYSTL